MASHSPPAWNRTPDAGEPFTELISAEKIAARVAELGAQITADYADKAFVEKLWD